MTIFRVAIYIFCMNLLSAHNIEDEMQATISPSSERSTVEKNYNNEDTLTNSHNADVDSGSNNQKYNNNDVLKNKETSENTRILVDDNKRQTINHDDTQEIIRTNENDIKNGESDFKKESDASTYQVIEDTLSCLASSMLPTEVVDALKSAEVSLLFHAMLNTLFIIFIFIFSIKVFFGASSQFDITAMNETLSKLQLDSVKMEQEKSEISAKIKDALLKVKKEEKDTAKSEKEEAEKKLTSLKKERESIVNTLSFLEQEKTQKEGKLKGHIEKTERMSQKNKCLEGELMEIEGQMTTMKQEIEMKNEELKDMTLAEEELKKQLQALKNNLTNLQDADAKATSDVSALEKRASELETENSQLRDEESKNKSEMEKKQEEEKQLKECLQQLQSLESPDVNSSDNQDIKLKDFISIHVVERKLWEEGREVDTAVNAIRNEEVMMASVKVKADAMQTDLDTRKDACQQAQQASKSAAMKMKTLSEYFKEKEKELNTRLKELESKMEENGGGAETNEDKINRLNKAAAQYKSQAEELQREIQEVESNYRKEVTSLERKSHDNWISYRQTEREAKDALAELNNLQAKISETTGGLDLLYEKNHKHTLETRIRPPLPLLPPSPRLPMPPFMAGFPPRPPFLPFPPPSPANPSLRLPTPSELFDKNSHFIPVTASDSRSPPFPHINSSRPKQ